jgi:MPBQ/MSBQ methyltransferase
VSGEIPRPDPDARALQTHYARPGLGDAILAGLRAAGKDPDAIAPDDLGPVDQFHTRGKAATVELARLAGLRPGHEVLDVGGGLGGPARTLAHEFGCRVTVLDLTEEYCRVGADLTRRAGLDDRVRFEPGDALTLPFPDAGFDVVWTQHSSMNVADKERLYAGLFRVLRPGGRLALHEIMGGPAGGPIHFPVPWARDPAWSFLRPADAVRRLLGERGFREEAWADVSGPALAWFRERVAAVEQAAAEPVAAAPAVAEPVAAGERSASGRRAPASPRLGFHLFLGPDFAQMFRNQIRNLEEGRVAVVEAVWVRP